MAKQLKNMTKAELVEMGNFLGLTLSDNLTKQEMITTIEKAQNSADDFDDYTEEVPVATIPATVDKVIEEKKIYPLAEETLIKGEEIETTNENLCVVCNKRKCTPAQLEYSLRTFGNPVCFRCQHTEEGKAMQKKYKASFRKHEAANEDCTCEWCKKEMKASDIKYAKAHRVEGLEDYYICYECQKGMKPKEDKGEYTCYTCGEKLNTYEIKYNKENKDKHLKNYCFCMKHHPVKEVKDKGEQYTSNTEKKLYCTCCYNRELTLEEKVIYLKALLKNKEKLSGIPLCPNCLIELYSQGLLQ